MNNLLNGDPGEHRREVAKRRRAAGVQDLPVVGPRSLVDMATAVLAKNAHLLSAEHVVELSDERRATLKKAIVKSCDLSALLWKILLPRKRARPAQSTAAERTHMFCSQARTPSDRLGPYIESLTAPSMEFVAHIRIRTCGPSLFGSADMTSLASMPNLGILEFIETSLTGYPPGTQFEPSVDEYLSRSETMSHSDSQANDRIMRRWCAARPVPFPELRVLRLWGCPAYALSPRSLEYAAAFPKLAYYEMSVVAIQRADRGAWAKTQVNQYAQKYLWHGFQYDMSDFAYTNTGDAGRRDVVNADAHPARRPRLTLQMVERDSTPHHAANWAGRIYSFAADTGFTLTRAHEADRASIQHTIEQLGRPDAVPITHHIASLSLGVDRVVRSYPRGMRPDAGDSAAFVFVRTNEQIRAQAAVNQAQREAQAAERAQRMAARRAQADAQAADEAKEAGQPERAVRPARKRAATTADPEPQRRTRVASAREKEAFRSMWDRT